MNRAILIGNLTNDPELKTTTSGTTVCNFRIAVNRNYKKEDGSRDTDFLNIVCWRQTAELCAKYLSKGRKVGIVGEIQTRSYDAQDGTKRYVTEIVAQEVEFLTPSGQRSEGYTAPSAQPSAQRAPSAPPASGEETEIDDDELPF